MEDYIHNIISIYHNKHKVNIMLRIEGVRRSRRPNESRRANRGVASVYPHPFCAEEIDQTSTEPHGSIIRKTRVRADRRKDLSATDQMCLSVDSKTLGTRQVELEERELTPLEDRVRRILESYAFNIAIGVLVALNVLLIFVEAELSGGGSVWPFDGLIVVPLLGVEIDM